jgi:hypothetical protein
MKKIFIITFIIILVQGCTDNRKNCSDSFATIIFVQEDINKLLLSRKSRKPSELKLLKIQNKTDKLLEYFDSYELNLFATVNLIRPELYNIDWCLDLEHNDHFEILTEKIVGEPCELVEGDYTATDLYIKLNTYNEYIDSLFNTKIGSDNPYFDWIMDPIKEKCLNGNERFYGMNLNNHIIAILRLK